MVLAGQHIPKSAWALPEYWYSSMCKSCPQPKPTAKPNQKNEPVWNKTKPKPHVNGSNKVGKMTPWRDLCALSRSPRGYLHAWWIHSSISLQNKSKQRQGCDSANHEDDVPNEKWQPYISNRNSDSHRRSTWSRNKGSKTRGVVILGRTTATTSITAATTTTSSVLTRVLS